MVSIPLVVAQPPQIAQAVAGTSYEAEAASLSGGAAAASCAACSGGQKVGNLGNGSGTATFSVTVPSAGAYGISLVYLTGETRSFRVAANGGTPVTTSVPASTWSSWVGYKGVTVTLNAGANSIVVSNPSAFAPDLDRILVRKGGSFSVSGAQQPTNVLERPSVVDYTTTQTTKLFLSVPDGAGGTKVSLDFAQALDKIRAADLLDGGAKKLVYLVGWQYNGHDDKYPAWGTVNPALKRPQDATALDSLKWLMAQAKNHHTTVSLHINMKDAFEASPLWGSYVADDLLIRNADGSLHQSEVYAGGQGYWVNWTREWEAGYAQSRIDDLVALLPLQDAGSVHIDAYFPQADPFHGTTVAQERETQRKVFRYWRDLGIDVTSEHLEQLGLQPAAFWLYGEVGSTADVVNLPASLVTFGETYGRGDGAQLEFLMGASSHQEGNFSDPDFERKYVADFALKTLPFLYLTTHSRVSYSNNVLTYSGGLVANASAANPASWTLVENGRVLRTGGDLLLPAPWITAHRQLMAYSTAGYAAKTWALPPDWSTVTRVDTYLTSSHGYVPLGQGVAVSGGSVSLGLPAGQLAVVVPAGTAVGPLAPSEIDSARFGSASATSDNGNGPGNAVDGDPATAWVASGGSFPQTLTADLGAVRPVSRIQQTFGENSGATYSYRIEGSSDGTNWAMLADRTAGTPGNHLEVPVSGAFRYVRLTVTNITGGNWASSRAFEVLSPTTNVAGTAAVTATSNNGNVPGNAVDGNTSTGWIASNGTFPQTLTADLGVVRPIARTEQVFADPSGTVYSYRIEGSTNGSSWAVLADRTAGVTGSLRSDAVGGSYRYVRLVVTGISGSGWAHSREFRVLAAPSVAAATMSSSSTNGNGPARAGDGRADTSWIASSGSFPQTLTADLGSSVPIAAVRQVFNDADTNTFSYRIEASVDGTTWAPVDDRSAGATGAVRDAAARGPARYVRLTVLGITNGNWASSRELQVWR